LVNRGNPFIPFRRIKRLLILGQGIALNRRLKARLGRPRELRLLLHKLARIFYYLWKPPKFAACV
jgi:hypothetical protein